MTRTMHVALGYILDGLTAQSKVTFLNGLTRRPGFPSFRCFRLVHLADLDALPAEVPAPTRDRNPRTPPSTISRDQRRNVYRWHHCPFLSIKSPCNSLPL